MLWRIIWKEVGVEMEKMVATVHGKGVVAWMWVVTILREIYLWNYFALSIKVSFAELFSQIASLSLPLSPLNYMEWKSNKK